MRGSWSAVVLVLLAVGELFWLNRFLNEPLPNATAAAKAPADAHKLTRSDLLWQSLPALIPGKTWSESLAGRAWNELSHVEHLPQRLPIVLAAALIAGAAFGLGGSVLAALRLRAAFSFAERAVLSFGLGMPLLGVLTLIAGRLGLLAPWPVRLALAAIGLAALIRAIPEWSRARKKKPASTAPDAANAVRWVGFGLVVGPFLLVMALGSMLPTIDYDALEYHLQGPKEYFQAGRIQMLPHNVYTSMPFGVEMLHLLGMEVMGDWWSGALVGQLLVALHAPMAAACLALTARMWASPRAAWVAAVVYLTTPWVYRLAVIPYVEGPLAFYHAALVFLAARTWLRPTSDPAIVRSWLVLGALAGGAMACKYPALISAVLPFGAWSIVEAIRRRRPMIVLVYILGWSVVMVPWLAKNVVDHGNPVYPLAWKVFGGQPWDQTLEDKWNAVHGPRPIERKLLVESALDVAGRSDWQSPLFVALAPLALLRPKTRYLVAVLSGYALYLFATWWLLTHRLDRFWLPILPVLALLAGLGADWLRSRDWTAILTVVLAFSIFANAVYCSTALAGFNEWTGDLVALRRSVPAMLNPPLVRMDELVPDDQTVLVVGQASVFYLNQKFLYTVVFDRETLEVLAEGGSTQLARELKARGIRFIYVDWFEIERFRSPGNYGFTDFVTPERFREWIAAGVLGPPTRIDEQRELYPVRD